MYTYLYSLLFPHVYVYVYCSKFFHLEKDIFAFLRQTSANLMFIFSGTCCSTLVRKILHSVCLDCLFGCLLGCFCFVFFWSFRKPDQHSLQRSTQSGKGICPLEKKNDGVVLWFLFQV